MRLPFFGGSKANASVRVVIMQTIEASDQALTESSTVRIRADVLKPLLAEQKAAYERSQSDNRTRQVWYSRLGAWLGLPGFMEEKSSLVRALNRKRRVSFQSCRSASERKLREACETRARIFEAATAHARESYAAATQHRDTSHAFVLQRLIGDAQGLGQVVNRKLREGRLTHSEATLIDDDYFVPDDFMRWIEFS